MFRGDFTSNTKLTERTNNHHHHTNNFLPKIPPKHLPMVSNAKPTAAADDDMDRFKPLHNFDLPCLKWGNQKLLRCMKVASNADSSVVDRNRSSETSAAAAAAGAVAPQRRNPDYHKRFRSSDHDDRKTQSYYRFSNSSSEKLKPRVGDGEIEATREKLMFDFQKEVGKMKDAILREGLVDPPPLPAVTGTTSNPAAERPWNLRTRRAACKAPRSPSNVVNSTGEVLKPNTSPVRNEFKYPNLRPASASTSGEKREREKFSVSLTRRELEEDFMAMAGRRLPRKPKKRPRFVQKQLDTLFPGLWLSEITADLYKVPDEADAGKR